MRRPSNLFLWFSLGHWANDFAPGSVWIIAPAIVLAMGLGPSELGLLLFIHAFGAALAYFPAGILADRTGWQGRLLHITFVWVAVGYLAASLAPGFWVVAFMMALAGLGDAAWHPIATSVLVRLRPEKKAEALGLHAIGGTLAEVTAPLAMGFLLAWVDWRLALALSAVPAALMALAFFRVAPAIPHNQRQGLSLPELRRFLGEWCHPRGLVIIASISAYNMANVAILAMMPLYLRESHGFGSEATGLAFSGMILAGALLQPLAGRLSDGFGRRPVVVLGNALALMAAASVWLWGQSLLLALVALTIAVLILTAIRAAHIAIAVDYSSQRAGATLGLTFSILDGVGAMGAWLAGLAAEATLANAFLFAAIMSGVAFILSLLRPSIRRPA